MTPALFFVSLADPSKSDSCGCVRFFWQSSFVLCYVVLCIDLVLSGQVFCLLSFVFCLLSFVFCLLSFVFCLLSLSLSLSCEGGMEERKDGRKKKKQSKK